LYDPVPQTGAWLRSVVLGYFNYHAMRGNLDTPGLFREHVFRFWGHTLKRRSQTRRCPWARRLKPAAQRVPAPAWIADLRERPPVSR
jgi:RNA-directed DNA polymerase